MTKALEIYPDKLFAADEIKFEPIAVNAYNKTIAQEKKLFSKEDRNDRGRCLVCSEPVIVSGACNRYP